MSEKITFTTEVVPSAGQVHAVAPGVFWLRAPLPFDKLDHVNLWILDDGKAWTIVDTGINLPESCAIWQGLLSGFLAGKPVRRIIVTHLHADHVGLAGWLCKNTGAELWMTRGEYAAGRMLWLDRQSEAESEKFYLRTGFDAGQATMAARMGNFYQHSATPIPAAFRCIFDGDVFDIGGRPWRVITGSGHSPDHVSLYCKDLNTLISGDQVMPYISPNISIWPQEPESNPLRLYLDSLKCFTPLPADTLVLPSHGQPFTGLHSRLDTLALHHSNRLDQTYDACRGEPKTSAEVLPVLFGQDLNKHQLFFAIGESLSHLHFLMEEGRVERFRTKDQADRFRAL